MRYTRWIFGLSKLAAAALISAPSLAQDITSEENSVIVWGRGETQIGIAAAASEGAVGGADLSVRPLLRVAELLEVVPGLIAAQHSGSGKANQYFLRGFNLDHGTDFTAYLDDVPLNLRTHGHGQGYLDVNGLIPELIDRVEYRKGPYRADTGDFSLAGSSHMHDRGSSSSAIHRGRERAIRLGPLRWRWHVRGRRWRPHAGRAR